VTNRIKRIIIKRYKFQSAFTAVLVTLKIPSHFGQGGVMEDFILNDMYLDENKMVFAMVMIVSLPPE
jgi:hypothetical protein